MATTCSVGDRGHVAELATLAFKVEEALQIFLIHKMKAMHGICIDTGVSTKTASTRTWTTNTGKTHRYVRGCPRAHCCQHWGTKDSPNVRHGDWTTTHRAHEVQGRSWDGPVHVRARWRHQIRDERGSQATTEGDVRLETIAKHWLDAPSCIQDLWWHMGAELSRRRCYVDNMGPSTSGVLRLDSV